MAWEAWRNGFNQLSAVVTGFLWHPVVLYVLLFVGIYLTLRSGFVQYRSLIHGSSLVLGLSGKSKGPGAISHFQALSAALSATVGLGNIGGVALAITIGGPGSVFWMWVVGLLGMAIKTVEVTLSMKFRNTEQPDNPHGGPMYMIRDGFAKHFPGRKKLGAGLAGMFCVTLLISTFTGGNAFQAWNTAIVTEQYFGVPSIVVGLVLGLIVACVILGGISRIGRVAGRIVPLMCGLYLVAALYVIWVNLDQVPMVIALIFKGAFGSLTGQGAFLGGTAGWAFSTGMQRAFFSNEAGQGSSSIAHSAVKTDEPAREGLVAGLEPFIDTLVVCSLTAMVILLSGSWNREPDVPLNATPEFFSTRDGHWQLEKTELENHLGASLAIGQRVTIPVNVPGAGGLSTMLSGEVTASPRKAVTWASIAADTKPELLASGFYHAYDGASLTAYSFDRVHPGLGRWLVSLATWFFAISTMISWSYYGEQGVVFLFGERWVLLYKFVFCGITVISASGLIQTSQEINHLTMLGTGAMLWVNVPILVLFSNEAMACLKDYYRRSATAEPTAKLPIAEGASDSR